MRPHGVITHASLESFERRAREGRVRSAVDGDLAMIVALLRVARDARAALEVLDDVEWNGYAWIGSSPCPSCGGDEPVHKGDCALAGAKEKLVAALASVPPERA